MKIYILVNELEQFCGAFYTKSEAEEEKTHDDRIIETTLALSKEYLQNEINTTSLGICLFCDTQLTINNVWYDEDNKPLCCCNCASDRYI